MLMDNVMNTKDIQEIMIEAIDSEEQINNEDKDECDNENEQKDEVINQLEVKSMTNEGKPSCIIVNDGIDSNIQLVTTYSEQITVA